MVINRFIIKSMCSGSDQMWYNKDSHMQSDLISLEVTYNDVEAVHV